MWFLPQWRGGLLSPGCSSAESLREYSDVFGSVEGNTTFYALPDRQRLALWLQQSRDDFRFCFKVPRDISHATDPVAAWRGKAGARFGWFLDHIMNSCPHKLGVVMLQLPVTSGIDSHSQLFSLLDLLAEVSSVRWAVEFRHPSFFDKGVAESGVLRALADRNMDRVIFDTRGLQADASMSEAVLDARRKKPHMPVHPVATGQNPVVRFIGHSDYEVNRRYLQQWRTKLAQWQSQGKTPWVFWHTAGNQDVPGFYQWVMQEIWQQRVEWPVRGQSLSLW